MSRLLLFDIDLTLVKTGGAGRIAMDAVFQRLTGKERPTEGISFDGRTDHAIFMEAIALHGLAEDDAAGKLAEVVELYLAELAATLPRTTGTILPGVESLLDALRATSAGVGLATGNLQRGARLKLGHYGLWDRFIAGGFGDETPVRAEVIRAAIDNIAAAAGLDPDPTQAIVIGDTPLDIEAARLAAARCLAVATGSYSVGQLEAAGADWTVDDLSDTPRILALLTT